MTKSAGKAPSPAWRHSPLPEQTAEGGRARTLETPPPRPQEAAELSNFPVWRAAGQLRMESSIPVPHVTWRRGCQASLPPAAPGDSSWLPHFPHSCLWGWLGLLLWWTGSGEDRPGALHPDDPKRKSSSEDGAVGKCPGGQLGLRDTSAGQAQLKPLDSAQREAGTLSPPGLSLANSLWQMGHF